MAFNADPPKNDVGAANSSIGDLGLYGLLVSEWYEMVLGRPLTPVGTATGIELDPVPLVRSEPEWLFDPSVSRGVLDLAVSNVDRYEYTFDPDLEVITDWAAFSGSTIVVRSTLRHVTVLN